jgi:hypothetical protein
VAPVAVQFVQHKMYAMLQMNFVLQSVQPVKQPHIVVVEQLNFATKEIHAILQRIQHVPHHLHALLDLPQPLACAINNFARLSKYAVQVME